MCSTISVIYFVIFLLHSSNHLSFQTEQYKHYKRCKIYSKLTIKTPEQRELNGSGVLIVKFEQTSYLSLVFLLLTLIMSLFVRNDWIERRLSAVPRYFDMN